MKIHCLALSACAVTMLAIGTTLAGTAQQTSERTEPNTGTLTKIQISVSDDHVVIGLLGDRLMLGVVQEISVPPFRLFVDLINVMPGVDSVTPVGHGSVEQVRVALNRSNPPVTRVVLDLSQLSTYRVERDPVSHEFKIIVGPLSSTNVATSKMLFELEKPTAVTAETSTIIEDYIHWFAQSTQEIERLLVKGPKIELGEKGQPLDQDSLEWQKMRQEVSMVTPPLSLQVAHDLLRTAVNLGYAEMREKKHLDTQPTDISAAKAGAKLLLMRARAIVEAKVLDASAADR